MFYLEGMLAAKVLLVDYEALKKSTQRLSPKYPFIRLENSGSKGRGGVKLLFEVSINQLNQAINQNKIPADTQIYLSHSQNQNGYEIVKFSDLLDKNLGYGVIKAKQSTGVKEKASTSLGARIKGAKNSVLSFDSNIDYTKTSATNLAKQLSSTKTNQESFAKSEASSVLASKNSSSDISTSSKAKSTAKPTYFSTTPEQKAKADERLRLIKEWQRNGAGLSMKEFCKVKNISSSNLCRWLANYKANGIMGLVDTRGKAKTGSTKLSGWMCEFIEDYFRAYGANGINLTQLYKDLHKEHCKRSGLNYYDFISGKSEPLFEAGVIARFLKAKFKKGSLEHTLITKGYDKAVSYHAPAAGAQDWWVSRRNQCWQIDSSPLDAFVRDGEGGVAIRAHVVSVIDVFSRRCVAMLVPKSNSLAIVRLLFKAFKTLGKPEMIVGDNGKDYMSKQVQHLLFGLGIDYDAARPYTGSDKAFVERHFRTLFHSGLKSLNGYIGHNLATREAIEAQTAKKYRKALDKFGHIKKTNSENLLTFEQMRKAFEALVMEWDMCVIGRENSPLKRWNSCNDPIKNVDENEFMLYAGGAIDKKITNKGITIDGVRYFSHEMATMVGNDVVVSINIDDVSECFVFSKGGEFICRAKDSTMLAMSAEEFSAANKIFKKQIRELLKLSKDARISLASRLSIEYDLATAKASFNAAIKQERRISDESEALRLIKQKLSEQRVINEIKDGEFSLVKFNKPLGHKTNSTQTIRLEDIIKKAASA